MDVNCLAKSSTEDNEEIFTGVRRLQNIDLSKSVPFHRDISVRRHDRVLT